MNKEILKALEETYKKGFMTAVEMFNTTVIAEKEIEKLLDESILKTRKKLNIK